MRSFLGIWKIYPNFVKLDSLKTKADLKKNFGQKFNNNTVNLNTGAIGETNMIKLANQMQAPMTVELDQRGNCILEIFMINLRSDGENNSAISLDD